MSIANGKIWDGKNLNKKLGIEHPYSDLSLSEYKSKIEGMAIFDLQQHASQVLVPLKNNRDSQIASLVKEFEIRKNNT